MSMLRNGLTVLNLTAFKTVFQLISKDFNPKMQQNGAFNMINTVCTVNTVYEYFYRQHRPKSSFAVMS